MYIFIDESGINKQDGKSSIALVYLEINKLDIIQTAVIETEKKLKIKHFHWSHSTWAVRQKFIEEICKYEFSIKIAFIKNPFKSNTAYEYALEHLIIEKNITNLIIDGKKNKTYERKFKKILRDKGISVKKLKTGNDEGYPALRVADAVAGVVRFNNENPANENIKNIYHLVSKKISITISD
ncbi:MAG: DUF3800 domain-containing protein [Candidatus Nomurabacteria bacterium]|nr:DUF3800 domain-containing protein [Candidatus Nomurabacteria bacterium]